MTTLSKDARVYIRTDRETREQAAHILDKYGLDLPTAVNMFLHQIVNVQGFPFEIAHNPYEKLIDEAMQEEPINPGGLDNLLEMIHDA